MTIFNMSVDGLPRLEARLRTFRFVIKKIIAESMREVGEDILKKRIQEAIIDGDYLFKSNFGEEPNLLDSIVITVKERGREIVLSVSSTVSYARFFEFGRPAGQFPDGMDNEYQNITDWLIRKKGVDPAKAPETAAYMIETLREEDDAFIFPDPVIGPAARAAEADYVRDLAILVNLKVEELR